MEHVKTESEQTDLGACIGELGRMLADLKSLEVGVSASRILPGEAVYRDQRDVFHQITLGAVLTAHGLSAHDARGLDGYLAMSPAELVGDHATALLWKEACARCDTIGGALVIFLSKARPRLEDLGRYAEWRRRYDNYMVRSERFLGALGNDKLEAMATRPASPKQLWLVRYTCECLGLPFPELADRRAAFLWLRNAGANPRYMQVQP